MGVGVVYDAPPLTRCEYGCYTVVGWEGGGNDCPASAQSAAICASRIRTDSLSSELHFIVAVNASSAVA